MKINRSIIQTFLFVMVIGGFAACTANYQDINKDPYGVGSDEMDRDGYNISSALVGMQSWVIPTTVNTFQFTDCHLGGTWGGYMAPSFTGFNDGHFATLSAADDWTGALFNDIIPKLYSSQKMLKEVTDDPIPLAIAEVIKIAAMHRVTDAYGPIPYSKIGERGELKAPYDSQKDVYAKMFAELDAAIATLTPVRAENISANADKIFGGKIEKWVKFANSLKLRLAMRLVYADAATARQMAESAISHEVGVMIDNSDNAALSSFGKDGNPLYVVMYNYNKGDLRIGADLTSYMNGYADPRRPAYFNKSTFTVDDRVTNDYHGLRSGIEIPSTAQKYSNANVTPNAPLQWMNSSEVAFLMAEAALRGWNVGGESAENLYGKGVRLSFEQWGVGGVDAYLNSLATPRSYTDPLGAFSNTDPVSQITIKWSGSDLETNLERIITQKWIANFGLYQEAWAEYRRTGYPKLMSIIKNVSNGTVDSKKGARRLNYPLNEYTTNAVNVNAAVSDFLGGPDNQGTKVWWDCKNK